MELLNTAEIQKELKELAVEWAVIDGVHLERVFEFEDFAQALEFVNEVGKIAEEQKHHPDVHLTYGKVTVQTTTHSENGLTVKDFELAKVIDKETTNG